MLDGLRCQKNSQTLYSQQAYQKNGSFTYTNLPGEVDTLAVPGLLK